MDKRFNLYLKSKLKRINPNSVAPYPSFICTATLVICIPKTKIAESQDIARYTLLFCKNTFYKNIEAEICEILRIL